MDLPKKTDDLVSITSRCRGGSDITDMTLQGASETELFQSPRGVGVVQTANPRACMVMRQTGIWISKKHLSCFIFATLFTIF